MNGSRLSKRLGICAKSTRNGFNSSIFSDFMILHQLLVGNHHLRLFAKRKNPFTKRFRPLKRNFLLMHCNGAEFDCTAVGFLISRFINPPSN